VYDGSVKSAEIAFVYYYVMAIQMSQQELAAVRLLNDLVGDLIGATGSFRVYQTNYFNSRLTPENKSLLRRMHIFYILLSLAKLNEFYKKYNRCIPPHLREAAKRLFQREFETRGIINFRNAVVGHLHEKRTKRPLETADIEDRLNKIIGPDLDDFLSWINNRNSSKDSVVVLCKKIRDTISTDHDTANS